MAKIIGKNAIILVGGYQLSSLFSSYETRGPSVKSVDVTGFTDGCENYLPGISTAEMTLNGYWDNAAGSLNDALKGLGTKNVSILPEGYILGAPSLSMSALQTTFNPGGNVGDAIQIGSIQFLQSGATIPGALSGWALQHGTITNTLTGTGYDDPSAGAVTAACAGVLHIWQACATDTYLVKIQHSTTLGSGYTDLITFTLNGSAIGSEAVTVASGTVNRYRRVIATRTGAAGNAFGFSVMFWHA